MSEARAQTVHRRRVGTSELALVAGDLLALEAQAIVCYSSTSLTLHSAVAVRIVERGGRAVRVDAAKHLPARVGDAIVLSAGRLPMRYVLVGVTNELRAAPTLDTVRASLRAALERAAALGLESLTLPLLRVRRRLDDDDLLVVTLAALVDHLSGPTSLRSALLLVDEDAAQAALAVQRVAPLLEALEQAGALRAQARALAGARALVEHLAPRQRALARELLARCGQALRRIAHLLEPLAGEGAAGRGGLRTELRACRAELEQVEASLAAGHERELGG